MKEEAMTAPLLPGSSWSSAGTAGGTAGGWGGKKGGHIIDRQVFLSAPTNPFPAPRLSRDQSLLTLLLPSHPSGLPQAAAGTTTQRLTTVTTIRL